MRAAAQLPEVQLRTPQAPELQATDASGDLIKVGIINNDPNESGYRTANDKDMKNTFTEAKRLRSILRIQLKERRADHRSTEVHPGWR